MSFVPYILKVVFLVVACLAAQSFIKGLLFVIIFWIVFWAVLKKVFGLEAVNCDEESMLYMSKEVFNIMTTLCFDKFDSEEVITMLKKNFFKEIRRTSTLVKIFGKYYFKSHDFSKAEIRQKYQDPVFIKVGKIENQEALAKFIVAQGKDPLPDDSLQFRFYLVDEFENG